MTVSMAADPNAALAEGLTYAYLSEALRTHSEASWADLRDVRGPALARVEPDHAALGRAISELVDAIARTPLADAQVARRRLFPPVETPDCPTYESAYRGRDDWGQADIMADVAGFYRAHGLRDGAPLRERPDHIGVELEFMSIVARKEADALVRGDVDQATVCRETGDVFLRDHLGCWGAAFGQRVERLATHPYLRATGELLTTWLEAELTARAIEPVEWAGGPIPKAFEPAEIEIPDDACAPSDGAPQVIPLESVVRRSSGRRAEES